MKSRFDMKVHLTRVGAIERAASKFEERFKAGSFRR